MAKKEKSPHEIGPCIRLAQLETLMCRIDEETTESRRALQARVDDVHERIVRLNGIEADVKKDREDVGRRIERIVEATRQEVSQVYEALNSSETSASGKWQTFETIASEKWQTIALTEERLRTFLEEWKQWRSTQEKQIDRSLMKIGILVSVLSMLMAAVISLLV